MNNFHRSTLIGYGALYPAIVQESGALYSEPRAKLTKSLFRYQIALNDRLDFEGAARDDLSDVVEELQGKERDKGAHVEDLITELPVDEQTRARTYIHTAVSEIESIEKWIRTHRDEGTITPAHIDTYRNVVNALSTVEL
jgi:hypothetical protein